MAYLEDILPQIRKGRKARRKGWHPQGYIYLNQSGELKDESNYDWEVASYNDLLPDDWELVPKPVKYKATVKLWSDGFLTTAYIRPSTEAKLIETREIEWSVE
jgi:hypothetical protein